VSQPAEQSARKQRAVADAIILERAALVLRRRYNFGNPGVLERIRFTAYTLETEAQQLRGECHSV